MLTTWVAFGLISVSPLAQLTEGVGPIASPGIPGGVAALDSRATAFIEGRDGKNWRPVAVASTLDRGRLVAFGHDGYLGSGVLTTGDTKKLLLNVFRWAGGNSQPRIGYFNGGHQPLLAGLGFTSVQNPQPTFEGIDVLLMDANSPLAGVEAFVRRGGGIVVGYTGWGWLQTHPGKTLSKDLAVNQLLTQAGMAITDSMLGDARPVASEDAATKLRADLGLTDLAAGKPADEELVTSAIRSLPATHPLFRKAASIATNVRDVVPTSANPIGLGQGRVRLGITIAQILGGSSEEGPALKAAADFPGAVAPNAKLQTIYVSPPLANEQWASTGAYAPAGQTITVQIPKDWVGKGLQVQVGCHSDTLWHLDKWQRMPDVVMSKPLDAEKTTIQSPYGGLVYILVPSARRSGLANAKGDVRIDQVVPAGWYVRGKTKLEQWKRDLDAGAPWAEIQGQNLIFTVPTAEAKKVEDPEALAKLWDDTMDKYVELDGNPMFPRPERIVADRQISAGYMHSGYPIMTWLDDSVPLSLSVKRLTTEGTWGHWHELGHNRQRAEWTFDGTGEVTNNIFTLYMMDKVAKQGIWKRLDEKARERAKTYLSAPEFVKWKSEPFLALTMYAELIDAFGWDAMKAYFRSFPKADRNPSDEKRRDDFLTHYSKVVGRNLSPFFQKWGVPTSEAARASLKELPAWSGPNSPK